MKTRTILIAVGLYCAHEVCAQTADDYIAQGRGYLVATNLTAANNCFSNAVVLSPANETANVLYGLSRVLAWPSEPTGSNFLTRLGVPAAGRDFFNWTAKVPDDTNGLVLAPAGVSAAEVTAMARTNLLGVALAADANLGQVKNTNFTLTLNADETHIVAVTLDYGDVQLLRSLAQTAAYLGYTLHAWNLDAQFTAVRAACANGSFNFEQLLSEYPILLTFATTNDLGAARTAFTNAVARYLAASDWIRNRPTNVTRLFNVSARKSATEADFRTTLENLRDSLNGAVPLAVNPLESVYLAAHFEGRVAPRTLLPETRGSGFVLGSFPDLTFGGIVSGLTRGGVEKAWSKWQTPIPYLPALWLTNQASEFEVNTLKGRGYVVQVSTDLAHWSDYAGFVGTAETYNFIDAQALTSARRFYRVVDRPLDHLPPPPNDNFANSTVLSGLGIVAYGYNASATTETNEPGYSWGGTVWYTWTAPASGVVVIATEGSTGYPWVNVYTGSTLSQLVPVDGYPNTGQSYNGFWFTAVSGTTYHIQVGGDPGGLQLEIGLPPELIITSPFDGTVFLVPTNFQISASAVGRDSPINSMSCSADNDHLVSAAGNSLSVLWTNVGPGVHSIELSASDDLGITTYGYVTVTVRPPNDNLANAISIPAGTSTVTGINLGASKEPGEPEIDGNPGDSSVWWSWTAPSNGPVTVTADLVSSYGYAIPALVGVYTGTVVSNLTVVAGNASAYDTTAQASFMATAGVRYLIAVDGSSYYWPNQGTVTLRLIPDEPPSLLLTSPADGITIVTTGVTNLVISATANDGDGVVTRVDFYHDGIYNSLGTVTNPPYTITWTNVGWGNYMLLAKARDNAGVSTWSDPVYFQVQPPPPPNDDFANATILSGANASASGYNAGATPQPGEPAPFGGTSGHSVWFAWTAPYSGAFTVSVSMPSVYYPLLAIYTGTELTNLNLFDSTSGYSFGVSSAFYASAGQTYMISLDDWQNGSTYTLTISP